MLTRLAEHHSPLLCVTARPHSGPVDDWVRDNLSLDPHQVEIIATGTYDNKAAVLLDKKITHFVEDRLETCFLLESICVDNIRTNKIRLDRMMKKLRLRNRVLKSTLSFAASIAF